jgi:hypothetical protein
LARRHIVDPEKRGLLEPESKSKQYKLTVTLPDLALTSIDTKGVWTGQALVSVRGPTADRLGKIASLAAASEVRKKYTPRPEVIWLIEEWNRRVKPPPYKSGERNQRFNLGELEDCEFNCIHLFDLLSKEDIAKLLDHYFMACAKGSHWWNGIDHSWRSLGSWVKAVEKSRSIAGADRLWFEPYSTGKPKRFDYDPDNDEHAELTTTVAENYAQLVLDRETYGEPDDQWEIFMCVAERVQQIIDYSEVKVRPPIVVKAVIRAAQSWQESFNRNRVYPSHLLSKHLWSVELPQFLKSHLPGITVPPNITDDDAAKESRKRG